jgi:hypothetical protein
VSLSSGAVVVPSFDCHTVGLASQALLEVVNNTNRYPVTGCVQTAGVLSEVTHSSYRSSNGSYNGLVHQIVTGHSSFAGVEPNLPVDAVDVAAVFVACFVPMVSLYLVGFAIRKVLHMIEGRR